MSYMWLHFEIFSTNIVFFCFDANNRSTEWNKTWSVLENRLSPVRKHSFILNIYQSKMNNSSFECATWTAKDENLYRVFSYWVGGIAVILVAIVGIILNITGIGLILAFRLSKHNIFNHIIVFLFIVDSVFLFVKIIDVLVQNFNVKNKILIIMFPKFAYPMSAICLTLSVFLTVGVAHERYVAIKHLIVHNQQNSSAKYRRTKLMKYILPMLLCAIAFNVPKFFEAELEWPDIHRLVI